MPLKTMKTSSMDIPLGLSMAMAQNPSLLPVFESLENSELKAIAGITGADKADMNGKVNGLYSAADSFGRIRMF